MSADMDLGRRVSADFGGWWVIREMTSSACEASGLLSCVQCESPVALLASPTSGSLRCDAGHENTFRDLLEGPSPSQRDGLLLMLEEWRLRQGAIEAAADRAQRRSMPDVADLYLAHAERFRGPIALLLQAFAGAEESAPQESANVG